MNIPIVHTNQAVSIIFEGRTFIVRKDADNYASVAQALVDQDENALRLALRLIHEDEDSSGPKPEIEYKLGDFSVRGDKAYYVETELPESISKRANDLLKEGLSLDFLANFVERLMLNPSYRARKELYDFLENRYIPITPDGYFLANKGVRNDYFSVTSGKEVPIMGKTNDSGHIYNGIGEEIQLRRGDVDDDRDRQCSYGLHVGSWDYASSFGRKCVIVKVDPAYVVSVPKDHNAQKCRVCRYWVLGDAEAPLDKSAYNVTEESETGVEQMTEEPDPWLLDDIDKILSESIRSNKTKDSDTHVIYDTDQENDYLDDIANYLEKRDDYTATLRQINNAMTAGNPSRWPWVPYQELVKILEEEGFNVKLNSDNECKGSVEVEM